MVIHLLGIDEIRRCNLHRGADIGHTGIHCIRSAVSRLLVAAARHQNHLLGPPTLGECAGEPRLAGSGRGPLFRQTNQLMVGEPAGLGIHE
jgi:hypothetical protein